MTLRVCSLLVSAPLILLLGACNGNQAASPSGSGTPGAQTGGQSSSQASEPGAALATPGKSNLPPELVRQASVSVEQARAIAFAKVPGATLDSEELEEENGSLIYSFDLVVPGRAGIDEVNVDANDASKVVVQHEGPAQEKAEKAADANPGS